MECVIDTSAVSWLERVSYLDLLLQLYDRIYAPQSVLKELEPHEPTREFVAAHIVPVTFKSKQQRDNFRQRVSYLRRKLGIKDIPDIEVFVAYKYVTKADEALYANKRAVEKFGPYGHIRDIANLHVLAEAKGVFTRAKSLVYLEALLTSDPPYQPPVILRIMEQLRGG